MDDHSTGLKGIYHQRGDKEATETSHEATRVEMRWNFNVTEKRCVQIKSIMAKEQ